MITPEDLQEWLDSTVDEGIINLNVHSLEGLEAYDYLLYSDKLKRTNTGTLSRDNLQRYAFLENGGWWCSGVDPLNNWEPMLWGCFKPRRPRIDFEKRKPIKYEHPPQTETRTFFLRVNWFIGLRVALKAGKGEEYEQRILQAYSRNQATKKETKTETKGFGSSNSSKHEGGTSGFNLYPGTGRVASSNICLGTAAIPREYLSEEDPGFWEWVSHEPAIPITITEGAKKAGALLTIGYAAIALPGIYGGYRTPKDEGGSVTGKSFLTPDVEHFSELGRDIYFCFDRDEKQKTVRNVNKAIEKTGFLFTQSGCKVWVISWQQPVKGVDDFLAAYGADAFEQVYQSAQPLKSWQRTLTQLTYPDALLVSQRYLGEISIPDNAKLVVFKAPKGSGKTEVIAGLCAEAYKSEQPVIVLTYREQLGKELARRFRLPYKTEIWDTPEGTLYGLTLCVDSAHPKSEAKFQGASWGNSLVVIDEAESVVWHLLNSGTCTNNRLSILEELETLFAAVLSYESKGQMVLADADASDLTIDFVKGLANKPDLQPYVVRNDYKPDNGWDVFSYQTPVDLYVTLTESIASGKHIIFTGGQKPSSKWGCQNLEKDLRKQFPQLRILRVDKETVGDPSHPAYGCIDNLNTVLPEWDVVIASPVIESGVSIDLCDHFAGVWAFSSGVIPTDNVRQTLARVRDIDVPRHIWAPHRGLPTSFVGNGATSPAALRNGEMKKAKLNFQLLLEAGVTVDADGNVNSNTTALQTWLQMAARINAGFQKYRETILLDLEAEGHSITRLDLQLSPEEGKQISDLMGDSRDELTQCEAELIADTMPPQTEAKYEELKAKKSKTPQERRSQVHYEMLQRYAAPPDADTILKDWDGWYSQIRLHYYLTVGNQHLSVRDEKRFTDIARDGRSWVPDSNRVLIGSKVAALQVLGLDKLFVEGVDWSQDSFEIQAIVNKALTCSNDVKLFLGVTVKSKNAPMATVQELLAQTMGFRLKKSGFIEKGIDSNGKRQRIRTYQFVPPKDGRDEVFERWLLRDGKSFELESVTSSEQMDHQTPIDLLKEFSDPKLGDPSIPEPDKFPALVDRRERVLGEEVKPIPTPNSSWQEEAPMTMPNVLGRAVEILTRCGEWFKGYSYVQRKGDLHQLADPTGYQGIFVTDDEFRFATG
jgi:hypothetical protein